MIRTRRGDEKPYWDLERARIGEGREVAVELVVNGTAVATQRIVADGKVQEVELSAGDRAQQLGRAADSAFVPHQPDLRRRRRTADPGVARQRRVVPQVGRPAVEPEITADCAARA